MEVEVLKYKITTSLDQVGLGGKKQMVNTINPHSYCVALEDKLFRQALQSSDILIPDGIGIVLAARFLKGKKIKKIAGADLHQYCLEKAQKEGKKVFYLGASQSTLDKIKLRLEKDFPGIESEFFSPPYKSVFSDQENNEMIEKVNAFEPDFLFVGMTAPKQEKWIFEHFEKLNVGVTCAIGAVFDFYAGTGKRPHPFWIKLGLEWFIRFIKEPKRLAGRNLISMPKFIWYTIKAKFSRNR